MQLDFRCMIWRPEICSSSYKVAFQSFDAPSMWDARHDRAWRIFCVCLPSSYICVLSGRAVSLGHHPPLYSCHVATARMLLVHPSSWLSAEPLTECKPSKDSKDGLQFKSFASFPTGTCPSSLLQPQPKVGDHDCYFHLPMRQSHNSMVRGGSNIVAYHQHKLQIHLFFSHRCETGLVTRKRVDQAVRQFELQPGT